MSLPALSIAWTLWLVPASQGVTSVPLFAVTPSVVAISADSVTPPATKGKAPASDSAKVDSIYTCPMDPQVIKHEPGNCPLCGMKLVKKAVPRDTTAKADTLKKKSDAMSAGEHHHPMS